MSVPTGDKHYMKKDNSAQSADKQPKAKRTPEKRLFHKPITPVKIIVYCILVLLLAGTAYAGRFVYVSLVDKRAAFPDPTPRPVPTVSLTPEETPEPTITLSPEELLAQSADLDFMKDRVNILLAGIDYAEERAGRSDFRTDTMMLFSVNFASGCVDIISVPRDSYADIAFTNKNWKINGAFMSAGGKEGQGFECMMETVSTTIGEVPVSYYVVVEMQAVKDIVDIIGGVWYDVDYDITMNGRTLKKGYQQLDGQAVLDYSRARKGITGGTDIGRIDRQQRLLLEVFSQLKSAKQLPKIPEIYNTMKSQIYTNLNFEQIAALSFFGLDLDPETDLNRFTLKGEYLNIPSMYYVLDHGYTQEIIMEIFGVEAVINWAYNIDYVKADAAATLFDETLLKIEDYIKQNSAKFQGDFKAKTDSQLSKARSLRRDFGKQLDKAAKSKNHRKIDPQKIEDSIKALEALYVELIKYQPPPPAPSPPPEAPAESTPAAAEPEPPIEP